MSFLRLNFFIFLKTLEKIQVFFVMVASFLCPFLRFGRQSPSLSELCTCVKLLSLAFPLAFPPKDSAVILGPKDSTRDFLHQVHFAPGVTHL